MGSFRLARTGVIAGAAILGSLALPAPAAAHVLALDVDDVAVAYPDRDVVVVTGTITCTQGEGYFFEYLNLDGQAIGTSFTTKKDCTGLPQVFRVVLQEGRPAMAGPAVVEGALIIGAKPEMKPRGYNTHAAVEFVSEEVTVVFSE